MKKKNVDFLEVIENQFLYLKIILIHSLFIKVYKKSNFLIMSDTGEITISTDWTSNDYANIITISAAAISSVLLVVFKSRCKNIKLCCGFIDCLRDPKDEEDDKNKKPRPVPPELPPLIPPENQ